VKIKYKLLSDHARLPMRMSYGAACYDVFACLRDRFPAEVKYKMADAEGLYHTVINARVDEDRPYVRIAPGCTALIPLGFATAIPMGYEAQIRPRSSANKLGITIPNAPGTIDSDYRGEWLVGIRNMNQYTIEINHDEAIAQVKFAPVEIVEADLVDELGETARGAGGFGSTGR
jgi:dUTP pyrophosphatase